MKAIFNGELLDLSQISLDVRDRGFRYGDGLFETIAVVDGQPRFLDKHLERVVNGSKILRFQIPQLTLQVLSEDCDRLLKTNGISKYGKIRFSIWRKDGGLYTPSGVENNYLITSELVGSPVFKKVSSVGFSKLVINYPTIYSSFKTISALKYVIAGIEKKETGFDEIIITDNNGFVSETLDSNIFMKVRGVYYTPPITTGCIEGVMRSWLIGELKANHLSVEERHITPNELLEADSLFTVNAMGLKHLLKVQDVLFEPDGMVQEMIDKIS